MNSNILVYRTLYKALPKEQRHSFRALWTSLDQNIYSQSEANAIAVSMAAMKVHDDYLKFFNIGQKKDQMDEVARVSKYVGLAAPKLYKP